MPPQSGSGEGLLPGLQMPPSCSSCGGEKASSPVSLLIRALIHHGASPPRPHLNLITSQRPPSPNTITVGVRASGYEFWGDINIQSIAPTKMLLILNEKF